MTDQVVVLGWDALDFELIKEYGLTDAFGPHCRKIGTYINPIIDEPHTKELWPSMITGQHPDEHGIHAITESDGIDWDNPVIDWASSFANGKVPQPVLDKIGAWLREEGAGLDQKRTAYYDEHDLTTVLDGDDRRGISIPNWRTAYDHEHGLDAMRDDVWGELLANRDGAEGMEPAITTPGVYDVLGREVGRRLGHTISAANTGHSLVWTWFGLLDTVGHVAPALDDPIERDWYQVAANVTETVKDVTSDETTVVAVSDHGLQDGEHTHYATLCSTERESLDRINGIFDIAPYLNSLQLDGSAGTAGVDAEGMGNVRENLQELGYVE